MHAVNARWKRLSQLSFNKMAASHAYGLLLLDVCEKNNKFFISLDKVVCFTKTFLFIS